jgi:hypothetical protein
MPESDLLAAASRAWGLVNSTQPSSLIAPELQSVLDVLEACEASFQASSVPASDYTEITDGLWRCRLAIHARLPEIAEDCIPRVRDIFRVSRNLEDYLGERCYGGPALEPSQVDFPHAPARPLLDPAEYYGEHWAPGHSREACQFRSGDILVARGPSFLSASIARVSDPPSQFSHIVLLSVGPEGEVKTLESYHHIGLKDYAIDEALRNDNVRLLWLRPKDASLGQRSADALRIVVERALEPIPYDFDLDFVNHDEVSCAEVASMAYELGSGGNVKLPLHESRISLKPMMRERLGLHQAHTFEPADLEVDPRFELVAEWRDYRLTRDSRHKDVILSAMFSWIDRFGYEFHRSLPVVLAEDAVWLGRKTFFWRLLRRLGAPAISRNMPKVLLTTLDEIERAGGALLQWLQEIDTGMTVSQLSQALEEERPKDLERFRRGQVARFHRLFRPPPQSA